MSEDNRPTPEQMAFYRAQVEAEDARLKQEEEARQAAAAAERQANLAELRAITDGAEFQAVFDQLAAIAPKFPFDAHVTYVPGSMKNLRDFVARYATPQG